MADLIALLQPRVKCGSARSYNTHAAMPTLTECRQKASRLKSPPPSSSNTEKTEVDNAMLLTARMPSRVTACWMDCTFTSPP